MEPLPTQGQTLRHYTASRPRPRRTHTQPPSSRPQEPVSKVENEASEVMGRVDEGVEEFFTKKIIADYALKGRWEESHPAQATPPASSSTPSASTPFSSTSDIITSSTTTTVTCPSIASTDTSFASNDVPPLLTSSPPPTSSSVTTTTTTFPTKNIKKKFGDFFAFKRARPGRATKAGGGEGGGGEGVKVKRTSIADLIRPLREAKERERERERDKEKEKERGGRSVEDANISNDATTTEGTIATSDHLAGNVREKMPSTKTLTTLTPPSENAQPHPSITTSPDLANAMLSSLDEDIVPVLPGHTPRPEISSPLTDQKMQLGGTPYGERRLKVTKRSLREGKSQSLILLTGLEPEDKDSTPSKKHASESTSSFEQRLQVMLHRMGVAKTSPAETKMCQNKDEELRKANSEGAILDKPEPPATYMKPRTMSTSSADSRHPMTALDPIRPELHLFPKPAIPERPMAPLPSSKPAIAAKPHLPTPAVAVEGGARPSSAPPTSSSTEQALLRAHTHDGRPGETTAQNVSLEGLRGAASTMSPRKELLPLAPSQWRGPSAQARAEKAQSVTDESLPKPRQHIKSIPQRRAVSVHEDALSITQELKAVLQRSPIRFRGNKWDLPSCTEDPSSGEEAQSAHTSDKGKQTGDEKKHTVQKEELEAERGRTCYGGTSETKHHLPGKEEGPASGRPSSTAQAQQEGQQEAAALQPCSQAAAFDKALCDRESPPARTHTLEKSPTIPTSQKKSPSIVTALPQALEKCPVSPRPREKSPSTIPVASVSSDISQVSPLSHQRSSSTLQPNMDMRTSTQERGEAISKDYTMRKEPPDQRTEPPLSE